MKNMLLILLAAAAFGAQGSSLAIDSLLEFCCPLTDRPAGGEGGRLQLSGAVFDQCRSFPADLRILDEDGTQWPYFILLPADRVRAEKQTPQILNKSFVGGPEPHWEFDLVMPEDNGLSVHNRLEIRTDGADFIRRVEISRNTQDGQTAHVGAGYLVSFSMNRTADNRTVSYPDSDAKLLHVRVYTSAKNADEEFDVQGVSVSCVDRIAAEREAVDAVRCPVPEKETDERTRTFILDSGFRNRPVEFITFDVADRLFVRSVSIFGRNDENEPWRSAGSGEIHRLEKGEETTVRVRAPYRWVKVDVREGDNLPLTIRSVQMEAIPRYMVFEAVGERPARLCFRGWDIAAPAYDLRQRISEAAALSLPVYELAPVQPNPRASAPSVWRKYSKGLGALAVGAVGLLLVWVVIGMMRRTSDSAG